MLRFTIWATLLPVVGCTSAPNAVMERELELFAESKTPGVVCVAYQDLGSSTWATVDADRVLHAASTMKVPVMIEAFRQIDAGKLSLDQQVQIRNSFASIVDGSEYELSPDDDSDAELYDAVGETRALGELVDRMITRSSNLATNLVIAMVDPREVQKTIELLGTRQMKVLRGVEDGKAYRAGLSNTATARDLAILMAAIARGEAASPGSCRRMIDILAAQEFNTMIPAGLPAGTRIAHKTGMITRIHHDAAIVYPGDDRPYVLVVLTANWDDPDESARVVAEVARIVHAQR